MTGVPFFRSVVMFAVCELLVGIISVELLSLRPQLDCVWGFCSDWMSVTVGGDVGIGLGTGMFCCWGGCDGCVNAEALLISSSSVSLT